MWRDGFAGFDDERNIRLAVFVQRSRHADDQAVGFRAAREIAGRLEAPTGDRGLDRPRLDVPQIALASRQLADLLGIDVEPEHPETHLGEAERERKADVAEPDDSNPRLARSDLVEERLQMFVHGFIPVEIPSAPARKRGHGSLQDSG